MNLYTKLKSKPLLYFVSLFVAMSVIALLITPYLTNTYQDFYLDLGNSYFESNINSEFALQRQVNIVKDEQNENELRILINFYDKKNDDGSFIQKFIAVNILNEVLIPTILVLILILSLPVNYKRKLLSVLIGFVLINLYIFFKLYAIAFDNYNSPEFIIKELPIIINSLVYLYNHFLNITGYSFNLVISIVICLLSSMRLDDLEKIRNSDLLKSK